MADLRSERRRGASRRRRNARRAALLVAIGSSVAVAVAAIVLHNGSNHRFAARFGASHPGLVVRQARARGSSGAVHLGGAALGFLRAPLQDAAGAASGDQLVLLGGLTASDTSTDAISTVVGGMQRAAGRLPSPRHDAAAVTLGGRVYVFGGGDAVGQLDEIVRFDPSRGGRASVVGRLPAASSDVGAAVVNGTAYIIGGYDGRAWLDTIVAWRPGRPARIAARLPVPLRYAAVATARGKIVIAGGSTHSGLTSRDVLVFDPSTRRVRRAARLPAPTTHAAGATLDGFVFVLGGRGATPGSATDRIVSVDPGSGRVRSAGRLPTALSDVSAVSLPDRIVIAGGRSSTGTVAELAELRIATARSGGAAPNRSGSTIGKRAVAAAGVYAHDGSGMLSAAVRGMPERIYVPNSLSNTVDVIDPRSFSIVGHFAVGALPQHVTPAYDLKTLYVLNDQGNSVTPINPKTSQPGKAIPVTDPYNMYFTPDGRLAIVVAERNARLDFREAHTFRLRRTLPVPCRGVDHMDFSADGRYLLASCEFSSQLIKIDVAREKVVGALSLDRGHGKPQDVKLSPDGRVFYVADMNAAGLWEVSGSPLRVLGFIPTGRGAHGLYPSRDARFLYVSNRDAGSVSVISFARRKVVATWRIPGGSPDMGGVSIDGNVLWLSGRYGGEVYAISTRTGRLIARIKVGAGPHGLSVWPQPGRYSLGHTGVMR